MPDAALEPDADPRDGEPFVFPRSPLARSASDVFRAVAHPARRAIIEHLADGPDEAGEIADVLFLHFGLRWPSTSNHLRVLLSARIVTVTPWNSYRIYELRDHALDELRGWSERYTAPPAASRPDFWFSGRRARDAASRD